MGGCQISEESKGFGCKDLLCHTCGMEERMIMTLVVVVVVVVVVMVSLPAQDDQQE